MTTGINGSPRPERNAIIAWTLCALVITSASFGFAYRWLSPLPPLSPGGLLDRLGWGWLLPVTFAILAALIMARQPGNRVGPLMMIAGFASAIANSGFAAYFATPRTELTPWLFVLLWFDNWLWVPLIFPVILIPLHFPSGRPPSRGWNWVNWLALWLWLVFVGAMPFFGSTIGPMEYDWHLPNPLGTISDEFVNGPFLFTWGIGLIVMLVASVASLVVRYRRAGAVERLQLRWLIFAGVIFIIIYIPTFFLTDPEATGFASQLWISLLLLAGIMGFAAAIAVAILRYRLWDIDVIIRRTLVYSVLTAILALVYFGTVILLQTFFARISGEQSTMSIVLSTLLIAALFSPLRGRVQEIIDRRFFRRKYDAQQALTGFSRLTRGEADLDELQQALLTVVRDTVQPEHAGVWISPKQKTQPHS